MYCNTPLPTISLSPSQILFHRELCDFTPSYPIHYQLHKDWMNMNRNMNNKNTSSA